MKKTLFDKQPKNEQPLAVDTPGLAALLHSGRQTATQIGTAAGARIQAGRRVFWNVKKVQTYLDSISE